MRTFLPLTFAELKAPTPPLRKSFRQLDSTEEGAVAALDDAAFASLELCMGTPVPGRIVAVGEDELLSWDNIECFHVDSDRGMSIAAKLPSANTQQELDALVAELWELPLEWYDRSELENLRDLWA